MDMFNVTGSECDEQQENERMAKELLLEGRERECGERWAAQWAAQWAN